MQMTFDEMILGLHQGNETAAQQVVELYQEEIHRFIRFRMTSRGLRRVLESMDISQSVFSRFFVDMREEKKTLNSPEQLKAFLLTIARNRLFDHARKLHTQKRDTTKMEFDGEIALEQASDCDPSPSTQCSNEELLKLVRSRIPAGDLRVLEDRLSGKSWGQLAEENDSTPEAIRKKISRLVDQVSQEIGATNSSN